MIITKPKITIAPSILEDLQTVVQDSGQVIIHCVNTAPIDMDFYVRIWPTTYLLDEHSAHRSELVHIENICLAPQWQLVRSGSSLYYSLIFSGLPKSCTVFDLEEIIPLPGRFSVKGIKRNKSDIYFVEI